MSSKSSEMEEDFFETLANYVQSGIYSDEFMASAPQSKRGQNNSDEHLSKVSIINLDMSQKTLKNSTKNGGGKYTPQLLRKYKTKDRMLR